jgi:hypothetical protein
MSEIVDAPEIYRRAAEICEQRGEEQLRDRFLVLAADAALGRGQANEAENLRLQLLLYNPHHLLEPYGSFSQAMATVDVLAYVDALRRSHPLNQAKHILASGSLSPMGYADLSKHAIAHEPRAEPESPELFRISDVERPDVMDTILSASNLARKPGRSRWRRIFFVRSKSSEAAAGASCFNQDIYSIREDGPENMGTRRFAAPELSRGPGIWIVLPLFGIVLAAGLVLVLSVLIRPLWI